MEISKEKIEKLKQLIDDNMVDFHNYEYKSYIEDYKSYLWDVSDRLAKKENRQMNMSYPLAFMMVDTVYWTVFDFDFQMTLKNKNLEAACVDAYDFKAYGKQTLWMASKEWLITGTWLFRDYTYFEEGKYEAFWEKVEYEIKSPTMEYISVFNVMYDRMKWLNDSNYKIVRQFLSESDIRKKIISSISWADLKKKVEASIKNLKWDENQAFSMYNYEAIKWLLFSTEFIDSVTDTKWTIKKWYTTELASVTTCLDLNYNKNDLLEATITASPYYNDFDYKYEVVEVIEWDNKHVFINWTYILSLEINPNIYNIVAIEFNKIPWTGKSIWIPRIIKQLADSSNWLMNMFLDSLKLSNTLIFKKKNWLPWKSERIKIESWQVLSWDLQRIDLWGGDFSWMNWIQALQGIAQSTLWINQMIMGWDSRVQRIAWAFDFAFSQYKSRLTPYTDSIDIWMIKVIKWWISQYISMYDEDELFDLYGIVVKKIKKKWVITDIELDDISIKQILNENNISFKFDSMYNLKKDANKKLAMDIFQLAQQYNNSKIDWQAFIKLLAGDQDVKLEDVLWIQKDYKELDSIDDMDMADLLKDEGIVENDFAMDDTKIPEQPLTDDLNNFDINQAELEPTLTDNLL